MGSAPASASAVPNGLPSPPQLHSSIPWFSPATLTRSWFLLPRSARRCTQRAAGVAILPFLAPEDRNSGMIYPPPWPVVQSTPTGAMLGRGWTFNLTLAISALFTSEEDDSDHSDNFVVKTCPKFIPVTSVTHFGWATPLLLTVAVIEPSIGVVLGFIGFKMILDYFSIHASMEASLGAVATCLRRGCTLKRLLKKYE